MIFKRLFRKAPAPALPDSHALAKAALNTSDPGGQRQACRTIEDLRVLRQAAEESPDIGTREVAAARYRHLLCRLESGAAQLDQALADITTILDPEHLGEIAGQAKAPELRLAAINQLPTDAPALARCAMEDALPGHRQHAVERLAERHLLEQVIKQIGKKDTKVYRLAREKLRMLAQQEERPRLARQRHAELCAQLECLGRHNNWIQDRARLRLLDQQWADIQADIQPEERETYQQLRAAFLARLEQHAKTNARLSSQRQAHAHRLARMRELIARLQPLVDATDPQQLATDLADIGEAWSALNEEFSGVAPDQSDNPPDVQPDVQPDAHQITEDPELVELRTVGQEVLNQALARQQQLIALSQATSAFPEQDANQAQQHTDRRHPPLPQDQEDRLLTETQALLATSGPLDHHCARKLQHQLEALLTTQSLAEDTQSTQVRVLLESLDRRLGKQQRHAERKLSAAPEQLKDLSKHLDAGELRKAESLYQKINAALDQARAAALPRADINSLDKQLKQHQTHLRELQRWRRWSADQGRESLCHEAECLAARAATDAADQELDTLAARLHQLRRDWRSIDQSGTPASDNYWQRFKQATDQVARRCEPYFQARTARQRASRDARRTLCEKLEHFIAAVDWDSVDWKAMVRAEREMRQAWNALGPMEDGARGGLEGRFRRALARVEKALKEERTRNQALKRDLIAKMQALAEHDDLDAAISQAKPLQKQWHTTVAGRKQEENMLWQQFRAASDALFARRHQARSSRDQELKDNQSRCDAVCEQAETLARASAAQASQLAADWEPLAQQWRDSLRLPLHRAEKNRLEQRWNQAEQAMQERLQVLRDQADWQDIDLLRQQSDFLSQIAQAVVAGSPLPSPAKLTEQWSALNTARQLDSVSSDPARRSPPTELEQTFATLLTTCQQSEASAQLAKLCETHRHAREDICLRLEILSHLDSPSQWVARRMEVQVERLQEKLRDGDTDPLTQSKPLLKRWYLSTPAAADTDLEARFARVESALRPPTQSGDHQSVFGSGQSSDQPPERSSGDRPGPASRKQDGHQQD